MKCPSCMSINPDDKKYCGDCGALLNVEVKNALHLGIKDAIKEQLKDQKVVEIEVAQAIASRLSEWAKLFGFFVGVPLAIFAIVLGFLGFKDYAALSDKVAIVQDEVTKTEKDILERLNQANKEADKVEARVNKTKEFYEKVDNDVKNLSLLSEKLGNILFNVQQLKKTNFPKIQIKLNDLNCDYEATIELAKQVARYVDILEIGNSCVEKYDLDLVKNIRARFPNKVIAVDLKAIVPGFDAEPFFTAGVNILIVPGSTNTNTLKDIIAMANDYGQQAQIQIDLTNVANKAEVAKAAAALHVHIIGVQTGIEGQIAGQTPFSELAHLLSLNLNVITSVAGGIKPSTVAQFIKIGTNIVVVGDAITKAKNPAAAAAEIRDIVDIAKSS